MRHLIFSALLLAFFLFITSAICMDSAPIDFAARNLATITKIYQTAAYPNNLPILQHGSSATPPGLFNANASGRVTPLGNFTGFADSTEYFFALSPVPGKSMGLLAPPNYNAFTSITMNSFSSQCAEVASSVVYLHTYVVKPGDPTNGQYVSTLKEIAFWRFDDEGAVLNYDAWIPNLPLWFSKYSGVALDGTGLFSVVAQKAAVTNLCTQVMKLCTGSNQQYSEGLLGLLPLADCEAQLTLKPFGTFDEIWGDNIVCRLVHIILAQVRPDVHCVHVGPTGGGKCVNIDYNTEYIADDEALFGSTDMFQCPPPPAPKPKVGEA